MNWYNKAKIDQLILSYWGVEPDIKTAGRIWEGVKEFVGHGAHAVGSALYAISRIPYTLTALVLDIFPYAISAGGMATPEENKEIEDIVKAYRNVFVETGKSIGGALKAGFGVGEKIIDIAAWTAGQMIKVVQSLSKNPKTIQAGEQAAEQVKTKILNFVPEAEQAQTEQAQAA